MTGLQKHYYFTLGRRVWKYRDQHVCLSVCSHISKTTYSNFTKVSTCMLPVTVVWLSSDDSAVCYVVTVLWMTSCFHVRGQIQIQAVHKLFTVSCPGGAAKFHTRGGGKSAMANCLVFTRLPSCSAHRPLGDSC